MIVVFQLVDELLTGEGDEVSFMGHKLQFHFEPQPIDILRNLLEEEPVAHGPIDENVLTEFTDELLADAQTNVAWIPDVIERQVYMSVLRLMLRIAEDVVCRQKLTVLGREVKMSIRSRAARSRNSITVSVADGAEAMLHSDEQDPLRTLSTTELEARLKDLDEQRRILEALQQLGGAYFDLTAEAPMANDEPAARPSAQMQSTPEQAGPTESNATTRQDVEVHEFQRLAHTLKLARSLSVKVEVDAAVTVPFKMIADLETYPLWMPWCTSGSITEPPSSSLPGVTQDFRGEVGFGFETGTFLGTLGDVVKYQVSAKAPVDGKDSETATSGQVIADAVNGFTYGERLVYDWRFRQITPTKTLVELDMLFQARSVLYMPIWDSMQHMVVNGMLTAFVDRAEKLHRQSDLDASK